MSNEIPKNEAVTREREASRAKQARSGCCGGAAPQGANACCALDADIKATGGSGCGCGPRAATGAGQGGGCC